MWKLVGFLLTVIVVVCQSSPTFPASKNEALVISTSSPSSGSSESTEEWGTETTSFNPRDDSASDEAKEEDTIHAAALKKSGDKTSLKPELYWFRIYSDIKYRYATTYVTSRVVNTHGSESQEVTFRVVLPETAFISKFIMEIDGVKYEAYVKEKEEAKKVYLQAQSQGQSAGLVELNTRNANVFNVNVNIKAQSKVNFNLTYEELLTRRLGKYEQAISITPEQILNVKDFQISVNIEESQNLTLLRVPNLRNDVEAAQDSVGNNEDAVIERPEPNKANITWRPSITDQTQLSKQGITGKFVVQYDIKRELDAGEVLVMNGYFVHFFAPENLAPLRKHVVFVLDTSGSMWGRRIEQLKEAMNQIINDLSESDYFNIFTFSSDVVLWSPEDRVSNSISNWTPPPFHGEFVLSSTQDPRKRQPYPATKENIAKAQLFIQSLVASGGTNIHDAVVQALNLTSAIKKSRDEAVVDNSTLVNTTINILPPNVESLVMFLTDGEPTVGIINPPTILSLIQLSNQNISAPIFSLAFGDGADFPFVRKLSLQNNGFARKIYEASDAALQLKGFYKEIASPLLSNVTFNYTTPESAYIVQNVTLTTFPTVFGGTEIAVAGQLVPKPVAEPINPENVNTTILGEISSTTNPDDVGVAPAQENETSLFVPTNEHYFDVEIGGSGREGTVFFAKPEVFSCIIPWGIPVVRPFPPRPTPAPTAEDTFLERLWAYLTIKQLIDKDLAAESKANEIPDDNSVLTPQFSPTFYLHPVTPRITVQITSTAASTPSVVTDVSALSEQSTSPKVSTDASTSSVTSTDVTGTPEATVTTSENVITNSTSSFNITERPLLVIAPPVPETPRQKALRLALKYGFVTSLTSLVVVKPNNTDVTDAVAADAKTPDAADSLATGGGFMANRISGASGIVPFAHYQNHFSAPVHQLSRPSSFGIPGPPGLQAYAPPPPPNYPIYGNIGLQRLPILGTTMYSTKHRTALLVKMGKRATTAPNNYMQYEESEDIDGEGVVQSILKPSVTSTTYTSTFETTELYTSPTPTTQGVPDETSTFSQESTGSSISNVPSKNFTLNALNWYTTGSPITIRGKDGDVEYDVLIGSNSTIETPQNCTIGNIGCSGQCLHLKDCVQSVFLQNFQLYATDYFCSIKSNSGERNLAGVCCPN